MSFLFPLAMAVTDLGESAVLLSTALAASGWFWFSRHRHLAMVWLITVGGCAATMVVLKLTFLTCGHLVLHGAVRTPSGHSAMSALFYGAAALTARKFSPQAAHHPLLLQGVAVLMALAIGASRIVVHAHSPQEVVIGLAVGFTWLGLFALALPARGPSLAMPPALVLCVLGLLYGGLLALTMAGRHMTMEGYLFHVARVLHIRWGVCTA
jgi:membrane-associated phospholipid phosphatase